MPFSTLTTFSSLTNGANLSVEYLGGKMGLRSSALSVKQMSDLIEYIRAFAAEQGVVWSDNARGHGA